MKNTANTVNIVNKIKSILSARERRSIGGLIVMMFIGGILELIGVSGILPLINSILNNDHETDYVIFLALGLTGVYVIKNLYLILMYKILFNFISRGKSRLSVKLMDVYMHEPYEFHLKRNVALIQRAVRSDTEGFYNVVRDLLQIICEIIICLILTALLFYTNWKMALFLMLLISICMGIVFMVSKKKISALGKKEMECSGKMNQWLLQGVGGIKEIRILGNEDYFTGKFKTESDISANNSSKQQLFMQLPRLLTETVCIGGVLIYIVLMCKMGSDLTKLLPTLGVFAVAAFRLLPSVGKINGLLNDYHFYKARVDFVYEDLAGIKTNENIIDKQNDDACKIQQMKYCDKIEIKNLSFTYDKDLPDVFNDVNFEIKKHKSVAFVGPSGAGKTTLADVIMGLLRPSSGDVLCDGVSVYENIRQWQNIIGYVPQSIYLSDDTIINNIAFGIAFEKIDTDKVNEVINKAQLAEFINTLPEGLNTVVGDRGVRLSGGQRQRIGIARALYQNPEILVMDEATSALDNETETAVMEAIDALHGEITMIIIAHRLSTIENCDEVYKVVDGKVIKGK